MKYSLFYIAILLTLLSCSNHPGQVKIQGRFAHLEQGEFFIYSSEGGTGQWDTLRIRDGKFEYMTALDGKSTMHILYPNYSQLTVFAEPGEDIDIEGDAQNLNAVKVNGSKDNELYTKFRHDIQDKQKAEIPTIARQHILKYPTAASSRYLFSQYFLLSDSATTQEVKEIYDSLCRACPDDIDISMLSRSVHTHGLLNVGKELPEFELETRHNFFLKKGEKQDSIVTNEDFKGQYLVMIFWARWKSGTRSALFSARKLRKELTKKNIKLGIISYSLDTDEPYLAGLEKRDSVDFPSFCDFRAFNSLLIQKWNIRDIPYYILVDPDSRIIATGKDWKEDIYSVAEKLEAVPDSLKKK